LGWLKETAWARAVYDVVAAIVAGVPPAQMRVDAAAGAPVAVWARVLALEGCAAWLDGPRRRAPGSAAALGAAEALARAAAGDALCNAIAAIQQVTEIAAVAAAVDVRLLALKGIGRLLAGEPPGARAMSDIDLLVAHRDAVRLHRALQSELGYAPEEPGTPGRHLPGLTRSRSLPVEIHRQLSEHPSAIDERIWAGARRIALGRATIEIPDSTALLMHALDHALVVHRTARYRLRDVIDVAILASHGVDAAELRRYVAAHGEQLALRTLLAAATAVPSSSPEPVRRIWPVTASVERDAWRRIRRVGRARLLAPSRYDVPAISDPRVLVLSQLAQGSPRTILRLAAHALAMPGRAVALVAGHWLPIEVERARTAASSVAETLAK
jgi:hypothetical protein